MKVAIDIGHGLDNGKGVVDKGTVSANGLSEYDYWSEHYPVILQDLERSGITAKKFERNEYGGITAENRAINNWGADIAVSLHLNSASTSAQGHEVIHYKNSTNGIKLATCINDALAEVLDSPKRQIKPPHNGRGDGFLSGIRGPAVIVEPGFLSSEEDTNRLVKNAEEICHAIARGICRYLGVDYVESEVPGEPEQPETPEKPEESEGLKIEFSGNVMTKGGNEIPIRLEGEVRITEKSY